MLLQRNVNCDKILLICYPPESGGKFIGNCLALSNSFYFQDENLMREQNAGLLPPNKKIELLLQRLSDVKITWTDLNMGDGQLNTRLQNRYNKSLANELSHGNVCWFQCVHAQGDLDSLSNRWPKHKRLILTNSNEFVNYRYGLNKKTDRIIYAHLHQDYTLGNDRSEHNDFEWDVNSFFDVDKFKSQIYNLYKSLDLTDFNEDYILQYYHAWMSVIARLRTTPEKITHVHGAAQRFRIFKN